MAKGTVILDHDQVQRKLQRIAHQLHERYFKEKAITLVGITPRGSSIADRLGKHLRDISQLKVTVLRMTLDKDAPLENPLTLSAELDTLKGGVVVLVDDVLMSGRTLMHAAAYLVKVPLAQLSTVVLVDRLHRTFPIRADIVGLTLSTNLQEHIIVELSTKDTVFLV